jgi:hypothetical protein
MRPTENIERFIKNRKPQVVTSADVDKRVLNDSFASMEEAMRTKSVAIQPKVWRIIMRSRITKIAAAAVVILIVVFSINLLDKSITPAYAIEQTIKANQSIRYFHFKYFGSSNKKMKEAWVEYDENGNLNQVRVNFYNWGGHDLVQFWKKDHAQQWNKQLKQNIHMYDQDYTEKILYFAQRYNPKGAIEYLYERQAKNDVTIEIQESPRKNGQVILTANYEPNTYLLVKEMPAMREVFLVDRETKLIISVEIYELKDGEYKESGVWKYLDYNKPFDSTIFTLQDEIPDDVIELYHYGVKDAGLEQNDLNEAQIVTKLVRQFFEALIAKDYTKAGYLFGGMPANDAEKKFGNLNVIRIISIGEPEQSDKYRGYKYKVPCFLELKRDEQIVEWQPKGPFIRQVDQTPNRWIINGGV